MFVNLERDVCTGCAGRFHIYTETAETGLVGCMPKECGRQSSSKASSSTAGAVRPTKMSGRILPRGRLESTLCDARGSHSYVGKDDLTAHSKYSY